MKAWASPETPRTYESVLLALDRATDPLDYAMTVVRHLESVATTPELRAAYNAIQEPVSSFYTSIPLDSNLWSAVKAVCRKCRCQDSGARSSALSAKDRYGFSACWR